MKHTKTLVILLLLSLGWGGAFSVYAQATGTADQPFSLFLPLVTSNNEMAMQETEASNDPLPDDESFVEPEFSADESVISAATTTITLLPTSYTTTSGASGDGQVVTNLHLQDQSGQQDDWDKYVEFTTPSIKNYIGHRSYTVPANLDLATITAIQIVANYKGPVKAYQTWTWTIYNWSTKKWVTLGNNTGAPDWQWKLFTFLAGGTLRSYVNSSTREIQVRLQSSNTKDDMDLDYEAVIVSAGTTGTITPVPTPTHTPTATPTPTPTATQPSASNNFYVATTGNDANPGTQNAPWRTIQKAANTVLPGSIVNVRGGIYQEAVTVNVSGSATGGYITFQSYGSEKAIIDGTGLSVPNADNALLLMQDRSYLIFQNLTLRNYRSSQANRYPNGILIQGVSHHIELRNNLLHNIETTYRGPFNETQGAGAHGILVLGTSATAAINNLVIDSNELRNLKLGWSESLTLNGNVDGFSITNNIIHDNNNIGIDISGGYDYVEIPDEVNAARNGVIRGNHVYNITSNGNPAYSPGYGAGGIYVDGGRNVTIEQNRIHHVDFGIELASENAGWATSNVTARNNLVYFNNSAGIAIGGYNDKDVGYTENCVIVNNTFFRNNQQQEEDTGELYIQYDTRNNIIQNNIFFAGNDNILIWNGYTANIGNNIDYNIYFALGGANGSTWNWKNITYNSFSAYQATTGNDSHSRFIDPKLTNLTTPDLHLQMTSPAINSGNSNANAGDFDIDGQPRRQGSAIDVGADEAS